MAPPPKKEMPCNIEIIWNALKGSVGMRACGASPKKATFPGNAHAKGPEGLLEKLSRPDGASRRYFVAGIVSPFDLLSSEKGPNGDFTPAC